MHYLDFLINCLNDVECRTIKEAINTILVGRGTVLVRNNGAYIAFGKEEFLIPREYNKENFDKLINFFKVNMDIYKYNREDV